MSLYESLVKNVGLGIEAANKRFFDDLDKRDDYDSDMSFTIKLGKYLGIKESDKLFDEIDDLVKTKLDPKAYGISRHFNIEPLIVKVDINGYKTYLHVEPMEITNMYLFILYTPALKDVQRKCDSIFKKHTIKSFDMGEGKVPYLVYDWKDCKILLQDL